MTRKIIVIEACEQCPHMAEMNPGGDCPDVFCGHPLMESPLIENIFSIPTWCPLANLK